MSARTLAIFVAIAAVVALLFYGLTSRSDDALAVGDPVPVDELPVLGEAGTGSIADYRGKWVLVNVWASWCDPCRDEAPDLQRFYRQHEGKDFEIVGVDTQDATDPALAFVEEFGLTYPQLHDGSGGYAKDSLRTTGVPENFLLDPQGDLAFALRGPITTEMLEQQVRPLIDGS